MKLNYIPLHSPWNPVLREEMLLYPSIHSHVKDPCLFIQTALLSQLLVLISHSSISAEGNTCSRNLNQMSALY